MKAIIEKKIRFIDTNDDFIEVVTSIYFCKIPVFWKSKKIVPPIFDVEMSKTSSLYKERVTNILFKD